MSDPLKVAEANVVRYRRALITHLNDSIPESVIVVAQLEGLILAHIQKTIANMMGRMS